MIIQDLGLKQDSGAVENGENKMFIREFINPIEEKENTEEELPFDIADDLVVFMRNDPMFYRKSYFPAVVKMQQAHDRQKRLDPEKLWGPLVDDAVKQYVNKFDIGRAADDVLTKETRQEAIHKLHHEELEHIRNGAY